MLVLTRKIGEKIRISDGLDSIEIMLIDVRGNRARIGVDAPVKLRVSRPLNGEQREGIADKQPGDIV